MYNGDSNEKLKAILLSPPSNSRLSVDELSGKHLLELAFSGVFSIQNCGSRGSQVHKLDELWAGGESQIDAAGSLCLFFCVGSKIDPACAKHAHQAIRLGAEEFYLQKLNSAQNP